MQMNTQAIERRQERDDGAVEVVEVFPTIQWEGPYAGRPAVFVRLAGCNLQCPLCDTDYTVARRLTSADDLVKQVSILLPPSGLVVITGGEPFRQTCGRMVSLLLPIAPVQFETNGTLYDSSMEPWWSQVSVVCSPKTGVIHPKLHPVVDSLKYILQDGKVDPTDGLPTDSLHFGVRPARPWPGFRGEIYIQPCDELDALRNKLNTEAAIQSCLRYGYTLCLQLHKLIGLP